MKLSHKTIKIVIPCLIILLSGWLLWQRNAPGKDSGPEKIVYDADPYADWTSYKSTLGGFTFKYPETWAFSGSRDGSYIDLYNLNGNENEVRLTAKSNLDIKENNFSLQIQVSGAKPDDSALDRQKWTRKPLKNGLELWVEKDSACPSLRLGSPQSLSSRLKNGMYLQARGSFCLTYGHTTTYTYKEQTSSNEWDTATAILESLTD